MTLTRRRRRLHLGQRPDRRQHPRQLAQLARLEPPQPLRPLGAHKRLERIHEQRERQLTLQLRGPPIEHEQPALVRARRKLAQHARLANPRLTAKPDRPRTPSLDLTERTLQRRQLLPAPEQRGGPLGHAPA